MELWIKKSFC